MKKITQKLIAIMLVMTIVAGGISKEAFADTRVIRCNDKYFDTLKEAVNEALSTNDGDGVVTILQDIEANEFIQINENQKLTIEGQEHVTINVKETSRFIDIKKGGVLNLKNIDIDGTDIKAEYGKTPFYVRGEINLNNATIKNFSSNSSTIILNSAKLNMDNASEISENSNITWGGYGGAISIEGSSHVKGGVVRNNWGSYYGGGLYASGTAYIEGTTFINNGCKWYGGGVACGLVGGGNILMKDCLFDGNYANWNGNAIYLNNSNEGAIYNTEVKNVNKSVSGAVTITGGRTTVAGLNVNNNSVNNGNVYIAGNNVSFLKPGTYNTEFGKIETNKNIIENNKANRGGGIYVQGNSNVNIEQCEIKNNTSNRGGAIYNDGNVVMDDVEISGNVANDKNGKINMGNAILQNGTLELKENVQINGNIHLIKDKYITIDKELLYHMNKQSALNITTDEKNENEFRKVAEFTNVLGESLAYKLVSDEGIKLENTSNLVADSKLVAINNEIGIATKVYKNEVVCKDEKGENIQGMELALYKDDDSNKYLGTTEASDENGKIVIDNLVAGKYKLKQKTVPDKYEQDNSKTVNFEVGEENVEQIEFSVNYKDEAPTAVITFEHKKIHIAQKYTFSAEKSMDDRGIVKYSWDFGDGTQKTGKTVKHEYLQSGDYIVLLTVTDTKGQTNTKKLKITADGTAEGMYQLGLTVTDTNTEAPIGNAEVYIVNSKNEIISSGKTANNGKYNYYLKGNESYSIVAYANGYYSRATSLNMGETSKKINLYLSSKDTIQADVSYKEMSYSEIVEAGIDTDSDENKKIFKYSTKLVFNKMTFPVNFYVNEKGDIVKNENKGGGEAASSREDNFYIEPIKADGNGTVYYLVVDGTTKWLKDMFDVQVLVVNNSKCEYVDNCNAKINLPEGLSLAAMAAGEDNSEKKEIGKIESGENKAVNWYVRGDKDGEYKISVTVEGEMKDDKGEVEPYQFRYDYACRESLWVIAGSSLKLDVYVNKYTYTGDLYTITYTYTNTSNKTINGMQLYFDSEKQYSNDGRVFVDCAKNTYKKVDELAPGEKITIKYTTQIQFKDKNGDEAYYELISMIMKTLPGSNASIPYEVHVKLNPIQLKGYVDKTNGVNANDGDPVDLLTGEFNYTYTDLESVAKYSIPVKRYYNSGNFNTNTGFGNGWSNEYDYRAVYEDNCVIIYIPTGGQIVFKDDGTGEYTCQTDNQKELIKNEDIYFYKEKGKEYQFDKEGKLIKITEEDGWVTNFSYDNNKLTQIKSNAGILKYSWEGNYIVNASINGIEVKYEYKSGNLVKVTNADGDSCAYEYNENNNLTLMTDYEGNEYVKNEYDSIGRVIKQKVADSGEYTFTYDDEKRENSCKSESGNVHTIKYNEDFYIIEDVEQDTTTYEYNAFGQLVEKTDSYGTTTYSYDIYGNVTNIVYPDNTSESYKYNSKGKVITYRNAIDSVTNYEYNTRGNLIKETDGLGNSVTYTYDSFGNVIREKSGQGNVISYSYTDSFQRAAVSDGSKNTIKYKYDKLGRKTEETNGNGEKTKFTYSLAGKLLKETDALGNETTYEVDKNGYTISQTDKNGNKTLNTYNKQGKKTEKTNALGVKSKYTYDIAGNLTKITDGLGYETTYTYDKYGNVISKTDASGNSWNYKYDFKGNLVETKDPYKKNKQYKYDSKGQVIEETDENGGKTTYTYNALGMVTKQTDPLGNSVRYEYDGNLNLIKETDKNGNTTEYVYDKENRLIEKKTLYGNTTYNYDKDGNLIRITEPENRKTEYEYDRYGQVILITDAQKEKTQYTYDAIGNITQILNPDGTAISYKYDKNSNVIQITDEKGNVEQYEYNAENKISKYVDKEGNITTYKYDENGNQIEVNEKQDLVITKKYNENNLLSEETDAIGTKKYVYDKLGRIVETISGEGYITSYRYDGVGNIIEKTDENNKITNYTYDLNNRLIKITNSEGEITEYSYDANGNVISEKDAKGNITLYEYDENNNPVKKTDANGNVSVWSYDANGNVTEYKNPQGVKQAYEYDGNGNIVKITDGRNNTVTMEYDSMNRMTKKVSANNVITQYSYDESGNLQTETDGNGNVTTYKYDKEGNCTEKIKTGSSEKYTYDKEGRLTSITYSDNSMEKFEYDVHGNKTSYTDKKGNTMTYIYDKDDRMTKTVDANGISTEYEYDGVGNLTKKTLHRKKGNSKADEVTTYSYDGNNNLICKTDALGKKESYEYDLNGNLVTVKNNSGKVVTSYSYDAVNNCTKKTVDGKTTTYEYNKNDYQTAMSTASGTISYVRDELDRITETVYENGKTVKYSYDNDGNKTGITYTDGKKVSYTYDGNKNVTEVADGDKKTTYTYDSDNNRITKTEGKETQESTYDIYGNVLAVSQKEDEDSKLIESYEYDLNGNVIKHYESGIINGKKKTTTYEYDSLNRLVSEKGDKTVTYTYDDVGNIIKETNGKKSTTYTYNNLNQQITKKKSSVFSIKRSNKYSENGTAKRTVNPEKEIKTYEISSLMDGTVSEIKKGISEKTAYTYDGLGNRTRETITTGLIKKKKKEKEYVWDYTEKYPVLLEEKESDGTIVRYTYAGNRERAYADVTKNSENAKAQAYSLYTDRLGSTRWALDENAEVAAKTEYDAWGKPETETVSSKLNGINISKSYTGYVYDETTGYWNAGARMYNSTDREFIQKDPKAGNVYETLTQNGYIYCGDNPLYYIDPDGCSYISTLGNAGRTAFNVVKSGVAGGLGFYTRICCEIDNMPTWAKAAVGTTGIIIAGASGVGAAAIAETVIASAGISAATDGAFYSIYALNNGSFSKSELKDTVINGAANGYMFAGAGLGVAGIRNAAKSGKLAGFMADETGSVAYEGGKKSRLLNELENSGVKYNPDNVVRVMKNSEGKLMWLENGNSKAGLTHILERHADDFASQGVSDIPKLLENVLSTNPIKSGSNVKGRFADYIWNGNSYRVAYGTNGFVVSFYPID
ncbi:PKD domain-containing protein [Eubacterium sp. LMAG:50]|uniref:PKD domain-containing protein n=1 Tax=Eubacterium sp. LMAG:50 TaxID=1969563 RepID=UPI0025C13488|nr:PKD domain-containing protein [Eubacterium sp. LMAG:50]